MNFYRLHTVEEVLEAINNKQVIEFTSFFDHPQASDAINDEREKSGWIVVSIAADKPGARAYIQRLLDGEHHAMRSKRLSTTSATFVFNKS